jgi:hypothetical protein
VKLRFNRSIGSAAAGVAVFSIAAALTFAQSAPKDVPRLPNGKPDFNGVWDHPRAGDLTKNAKACGSGTKGCIHEGPANLSYTAAGMNKWKNGSHYDYTARCLPWGYTRSWGTEYPVEFLQTPQRMAILFESNNLYHVIPTDGTALPKDADPNWNGTSVGHWEGDTLVVDTVGFNDKTYLDTAEHPHGEKLHITEKFSPIDKDHISREVTYTDPETYEQPFVVKETLARMKPGSELMEYVCMENNKDLLEGHLNGTGR